MAIQTIASSTETAQQPRLLDQVRGAALARFGRPEPGQRYAEWTKRFILFHESLEKTMIYTHVARKGPAGITSPLDLLNDFQFEEVNVAVMATRRLQCHS
jgi:hypothetical protein